MYKQNNTINNVMTLAYLALAVSDEFFPLYGYKLRDESLCYKRYPTIDLSITWMPLLDVHPPLMPLYQLPNYQRLDLPLSLFSSHVVQPHPRLLELLAVRRRRRLSPLCTLGPPISRGDRALDKDNLVLSAVEVVANDELVAVSPEGCAGFWDEQGRVGL